MDPELTMTLPDYLTACGCTDILMHTMAHRQQEIHVFPLGQFNALIHQGQPGVRPRIS